MQSIRGKVGVYAVYPRATELQAIVKAFNQAGFQNDEICLLLAPGHPIAMEMREMRSSGRIPTSGSALEMLVKWLTGLGAVVISNLVFFVRSAEFFNALVEERTSLAAGHRGALANLGIPEREAAHLGSRISNGGGLVYVDCSRTKFSALAVGIFRQTGGEETSCLQAPSFFQAERSSAAMEA